MGDGFFLTRSMLNSLVKKEKNVALTPNIYQKLSVNNNFLSISSGDVSVNIPLKNAAEIEYAATASDRDRDVAWIISMSRQFDIGIKTLGLAVSIFDRVLCLSKVRPKYLKCLAVTSLYLAVKFHEEIEDVDNTNPYYVYTEIRQRYSVQELNRMERTILAILKWDLLLPSIGAPHLMYSPTLRQNFEQVISRWSFVSLYRPSVLALSLLSLMLETTLSNCERITTSLMGIFKVELEQFNKSKEKLSEITHGKENVTKRTSAKISRNIVTTGTAKLSRKRSRGIFEVFLNNDTSPAKNSDSASEKSSNPSENNKDMHKGIQKAIFNLE